MDPDGNPVKCKASLKYLGAVLQNTGRIDPEISSKFGIARQDFRSLVQIWQHANISKRRKIQLYHSLVLSSLGRIQIVDVETDIIRDMYQNFSA